MFPLGERIAIEIIPPFDFLSKPIGECLEVGLDPIEKTHPEPQYHVSNVAFGLVSAVETLSLPKQNMKTILLLTCVIPLLTTTGCLVAEGRRGHYHGHGSYRAHAEVIVPAPPTIVVRPPEIIVR